jgi:hypothetical protein
LPQRRGALAKQSPLGKLAERFLVLCGDPLSDPHSALKFTPILGLLALLLQFRSNDRPLPVGHLSCSSLYLRLKMACFKAEHIVNLRL